MPEKDWSKKWVEDLKREARERAGRRAPAPAPSQDALPLDVADTRPPPREEWVRGLIHKEEA